MYILTILSIYLILIFSLNYISIKGHLIRHCPLAECKKCGASGHWDRYCEVPANQLKKNSSNRKSGGGHVAAEMANAAAIDKENVTSIDYHHLASASNIADEYQKPTKTMLSFFYDRLLEKRKSPQLSEEMIHTWRLAGHNQHTIFEMMKKNRPPNRTQLRLMLVKELAKASAASLPISVNISELLDETVHYFMPEDRVNIMDSKISVKPSSSNQTSETEMRNVSNQQSFDKLNKLSSMLDLALGPPGSQERALMYDNMASMNPLSNYIFHRMKKLAAQFAISDEYIEQTATIIIKLMAVTNFNLMIMKRHLASYGSVSLAALISAKTKLYQAHFPPGISAKFIITFVLDFLQEHCE